jgi:uncharacterized protein YjbI with pentapeptide repeats
MTVRDWLPIVRALLIPIVVALGTWAITWQQGKLENQRAEQGQMIENQRAAAERDLAEQRADDEAIQAYLDQMSTLLLENNLRDAQQDSEIRTLARARTLTVLRRLGPEDKTRVIQFLGETHLIEEVDGKDPVVELRHADLSGVDFSEYALIDFEGDDPVAMGADVGLRGADLRLANLSDADLLEVDLSGADLSGATVSYANLREANLSGANLSSSYLIGTDFHGADLTNAQVSEVQLREAESLEGATMPNGQKYEG